MKASEFRDQTIEELQAILKEKQNKLYELKNKLAREKKVENRGDFLKLKKEIARINTVLTEKERS